eukprot:PhM_4_TR17425/c0_g1_i1/m.77953/K01590/hdc, HDC; histidine decarboxylase
MKRWSASTTRTFSYYYSFSRRFALEPQSQPQRRYYGTVTTQTPLDFLHALHRPHNNTVHRDVLVSLSERLFHAHPHFVAGLRANGFYVLCRPSSWIPKPSGHVTPSTIDLSSDLATDTNPPSVDKARFNYADIVNQHHSFLRVRSKNKIGVRRPHLVLAFEDEQHVVADASRAGACVIGIGSNRIDQDQLRASGARYSALSIDTVLETFHIQSYFQVQYLPFNITLKDMIRTKVGYPMAMVDLLHGQYTADGVDVKEGAPRLVPRQALGINEGTYADLCLNNVGWSMDSSKTWRMNSRDSERDIMRMFSRLYDLPEDEGRGFVTSGGTEGNFTGLWWQRDCLAGKTRRMFPELATASDDAVRPILLFSEHTHYSCQKVAQQLNLRVRVFSSNPDGTTDAEAFRKAVSEVHAAEPHRPLLLLATSGTTQTGATEDLVAMNAVLSDVVGDSVPHSIHLDAALLGPTIPFTKPWGDANLFRDLNVKTLSVSGHKFFGSTTVCGVCFTTDAYLKEYHSEVEVHRVSYLGGSTDLTPSGSRNGFSAITFHNTLCSLDMHTDRRRLSCVVAQCYRNREMFLSKMRSIVGDALVISPPRSLNAVFPRPGDDLMAKYHLMPISLPNSPAGKDVALAGVCCLLNMHSALVDEFVRDYALFWSTVKNDILCDSGVRESSSTSVRK